MKFKIFLFISALVCVLPSCFEDTSNTSIDIINPIVIDLGDELTSVSAYMLDTLELKPIVYKTGLDDSGLSFRWTISGNDVAEMVIDTKMNLKAVVAVPAAAEAYDITLTVTDNETGLQGFQSYYLTVLSALGKGLIVADTKDGGLSSDLNLIVSKEFTQGYLAFNEKDNRIWYDIYSQINYESMEGSVKNMVSCYDYRQPLPRTLTVLTDSHAYRMDPYEYVLQERDGQMYVLPDIFDNNGFNPQFLGHNDYPAYEYMIVNGLVYPRSVQWGSYIYRLNMEPSDYTSYYATMGTSYTPGGYDFTAISIFDQQNNRFFKVYGAFGEGDLMVMDSPALPVGTQAAFDLNDLGEDHTAVYMGAGNNIGSYATTFAIMKTVRGGNYYLYTFYTGYEYTTEADYYPVAKYPLDGYEGFTTSTAWECSPIENVLYYASGDKVYSMLLSGTTPVVQQCFTTTDPNERITSMQLWRVSGQGQVRFKDSTNPEGGYTSYAQNRMMLIATYNDATGEGKITAVPVMNIGSGTLETDRNFHVVFEGFGLITAMAPQTV